MDKINNLNKARESLNQVRQYLLMAYADELAEVAYSLQKVIDSRVEDIMNIKTIKYEAQERCDGHCYHDVFSSVQSSTTCKTKCVYGRAIEVLRRKGMLEAESEEC
jgi:hypothetical protein